jgi:hypothetical protein
MVELSASQTALVPWRATRTATIDRLTIGQDTTVTLVLPPWDGTTDARAEPAALSLTFPNPARGKVEFSLSTPNASDVDLRIFDVQGRIVARPIHGRVHAGPARLIWNPSGPAGQLAPGIYVVVLAQGNLHLTRRIVLLR